jgi:hypothetical protein
MGRWGGDGSRRGGCEIQAVTWTELVVDTEASMRRKKLAFRREPGGKE